LFPGFLADFISQPFAHGCEIKSEEMRLKVTIVQTYGTVVMELRQHKQYLMDYTLTLN